MTRRLGALPRLPREGGDPTIAMTEAVRPFMGTWYDKETGVDCLVISESNPGIVTIRFAESSDGLMVVDAPRIDGDSLVFDTALYWKVEPPHPWLADAQGMRMRCELRPAGDDPGILIQSISAQVAGVESESTQLHLRDPAGGR